MSFTSERWASVRIGGAFYSDNWSVGIWLRFPDGAGSPAPADADQLASTVLSQFQTKVWAGATVPLRQRNGGSISLINSYAVYYINGVPIVSGRATQTPDPGISATPALPPSTALCVTLRTDRAGRMNRGRVYLPYTSGTLTGGLQAPSADVLQLAANMKAWLDGVNAATLSIETSPTHRVIIGSKVAPNSAPVSSVAINSVLDTQRGRGDNFVATSVATGTLA